MSGQLKPKVAFFDFTSCEGCQLTVVDSLQDYPDLLEAVEIVQFREAMSEKGEDYLVAFIEGSCSRPADAERLMQIRSQAAIVVTLGTCAHLGGINALKYWQPLEEARRYVYGEDYRWFDTADVRPIEAVIPVEAAIPGCPIDRREFIACVKALLLGKKLPIPDYPVCVECKLKENACLYRSGKACLGPVTRAGCGAICPSFVQGCAGCRGFVSNPNKTALQELQAQLGLPVEALEDRYTLFNTYPVRETILRDRLNAEARER